MNEFTITRPIAAPVATVWVVLDDFGNIADWSSGIKRSALTSEGPVGEGTTRHCDFVPLGGVNERIVAYVPNERMTLHLFETFKMPVSEAVADFRLTAVGDTTELTLAMRYTPNRLGRAAKKTTDKQMRRFMTSLADDLTGKSEGVAALNLDEGGHGAT